MKKILSSLAILLAGLVIITGCKGGLSNLGPKETLVAFFEKLSKKDIDGAAQYATKDSKSTLDMMKKGMDMAEKMKDEKEPKEDPTEEFKSMEVGDPKINGDMATVPVKNAKKGSEVDFPLKKEDGAWKVDFSMGTLMKMGMDAKNQHAMDNGGSADLDTAMQNIDPEKMKKSVEMADSIMKHMDPEKMKEAAEMIKKMKEQSK